MKKIGFLSFGHWSNHPAYSTRTAGDTWVSLLTWLLPLKKLVWMVPISECIILPLS